MESAARFTVDLTDVPTLVITAAALVGAWGVLWRGLVRPAYRRIHVMYELVQKELTPNGGSSMKDSTTRAAGAVTQAVEAATKAAAAVEALAGQVTEVQENQETIFQLLDNVVERKQSDHEEMWAVLRSLGMDRRKPTEGAS